MYHISFKHVDYILYPFGVTGCDHRNMFVFFAFEEEELGRGSKGRTTRAWFERGV